MEEQQQEEQQDMQLVQPDVQAPRQQSSEEEFVVLRRKKKKNENAIRCQFDKEKSGIFETKSYIYQIVKKNYLWKRFLLSNSVVSRTMSTDENSEYFWRKLQLIYFSCILDISTF